MTSSTCGAGVDNLKMALGHRVRTNINPLLSTFYCKYTVNRSRFQGTHLSKENVKYNDAERSPTAYKSFDQMILFRRDQAQRSVLLKLNSIRCLNEIEKHFPHNDKILHVLPYATVNDKIFVLVEFQSSKTVQIVKDKIYHVPMKEVVHAHSPVIYLQEPNYWNLSKKHEQILKNKVHPYSKFKDCVNSHIWQQLQTIKNVSSQMVLLSNLLSITDMDIRLRFYTATQISYYVSKLFTNISVIPFGSSVNGFGQIGCDLDLLCKVELEKAAFDWRKLLSLGQHFSLDDRKVQVEFLELIGIVMRRCMPGIYNIKKIMEARVPIIKFFNSFTNMQCDLSSSNGFALNMSEILYIYSHLDSRVKPLVCTIRKWARTATVTKETSGPWITNFSLTLLIIFYLQTRKILPPLNEVQHLAGTQRVNLSVPNEQWFSKGKGYSHIKNTENLHSLLYGFFEYYSIFDFGKQGICVRDAKVKEKKDSSPLYIYNPLETSLNVSKNVNQAELYRTIGRFQAALHILTELDDAHIILKLLDIVPHNTVVSKHTAKTSQPATDETDDHILNNNNNKGGGEGNEKLINEGLLAHSAVVNDTKSIIK